MQPADPDPSAQFNAPFEDEPEFGWCRIVEEWPDEQHASTEGDLPFFDQVLAILGLLLSHLGYGFLPASDVRVSWFLFGMYGTPWVVLKHGQVFLLLWKEA